MNRRLPQIVLLSSGICLGIIAVALRLGSSSAPAATPDTTTAAAKPLSDSPTGGGQSSIDPVAAQIRPGDWNQWSGSPSRNEIPDGKGIPTDWNPDTLKNIKWSVPLGSQCYGSPVVANGKVFIGTNNGHGYLNRYPETVDLGVLLCFNETDGKFLWQDSNAKLPNWRVNDSRLVGICSTPLVEGHRLWYVTNRCEVKCLDTDERKAGTTDEPKVIWTLDMIKTLGVFQHNMSKCSVTDAGDLLFVITSNGVDVGHRFLPAPDAPSFICLNKNTGAVYWTDSSPGENVLHCQWSSPAYAVLGDVPQVIFGGGDGYLYSFLGTKENDHGRPKLLWKFDCNPKESKFVVGARSDRNQIIGTPAIYKGLIYIGVGEDPEHGEGTGHLWCIDPRKRGDVSPELAFKIDDLVHPIPPHRNQAVVQANGEVARANPNSAAVWHYDQFDLNGNGKIDFEEIMHRTISTARIKNDLLVIPDSSGVLHCLDAKTGKPYWSYDLLSACWSSPLIVEDKIYISDEDGDVFIFRLAPKLELISKTSDGRPGGISMGDAIFSTPVVAQNVLYIATENRLFAIQPPARLPAH